MAPFEKKIWRAGISASVGRMAARWQEGGGELLGKMLAAAALPAKAMGRNYAEICFRRAVLIFVACKRREGAMNVAPAQQGPVSEHLGWPPTP